MDLDTNGAKNTVRSQIYDMQQGLGATVCICVPYTNVAMQPLNIEAYLLIPIASDHEIASIETSSPKSDGSQTAMAPTRRDRVSYDLPAIETIPTRASASSLFPAPYCAPSTALPDTPRATNATLFIAREEIAKDKTIRVQNLIHQQRHHHSQA